MKLYSTNNLNLVVSFKEAVLSGLAPDGGLFMPVALPKFGGDFFENLKGRPLRDIAFELSRIFLADELPEETIRRICDEAINFDAPFVKLSDDIFALELFHGPTLAFKDFGARFMARVMAHLKDGANRELVILVATSGDTGSAVARGFLNVPGIRVFILYPAGGVSPMQEKMLTAAGGNITALKIHGSFDDCQRLVKTAFVDPDLRSRIAFSSANSINIARLIPQMFYYVYGWARAAEIARARPIIFSVPSGNFGNLTAGLMIKRMGLPIARFIAACNVNDTVAEYLRTGVFAPRPSVRTLSNAMDVGNPSNFARMLELYGHSAENMRKDLWAATCTDEETRRAIREVYAKHKYALDPHGAVGYLGLEQYRIERKEPFFGVFLETAHPAKFPELIHEELGISLPLPPQISGLEAGEAVPLAGDFSAFKEFLLSAVLTDAAGVLS